MTWPLRGAPQSPSHSPWSTGWQSSVWPQLLGDTVGTVYVGINLQIPNPHHYHPLIWVFVHTNGIMATQELQIITVWEYQAKVQENQNLTKVVDLPRTEISSPKVNGIEERWGNLQGQLCCHSEVASNFGSVTVLYMYILKGVDTSSSLSLSLDVSLMSGTCTKLPLEPMPPLPAGLLVWHRAAGCRFGQVYFFCRGFKEKIAPLLRWLIHGDCGGCPWIQDVFPRWW